MSDYRCSAVEKAPGKICECHKKLVQFGIPLYICEEAECYEEQSKAITYEKAFRLPGKLAINDEITEYLKVEENDLPVVFEQMAEIFPTLNDYEENFLSFWLLDVLIEGLWAAQNAKMDFHHQKATLMWIAYFFNFIQEENPSRRQLFRHLKVILFQNESHQCNEEGTAESLEECTLTDNFMSNQTHWSLPLPPRIYRAQSKPQEILKEKFSEEGSTSVEEYHSEEGSNSLSSVISMNPSPSEQDSDRNLSDMKIILEILYRIFARAYAYQNIQTVFNSMPSLEQVKLPFPLKIPKTLAKPEVPGLGKTERSGRRSTFEKYSDEIETERQLIKNNYILPLEVSEEAKEYLKQHSSERSVFWRNKDDKSKK